LAGVQLKGSVNENQLFAVLLVDAGERNHRNSRLAGHVRGALGWTGDAEGTPPALDSAASPEVSARSTCLRHKISRHLRNPKRRKSFPPQKKSHQLPDFASHSAVGQGGTREPATFISPVSSPRLSPPLRVSASNPLPVVSRPHRVRRRLSLRRP